MDTQASTQERPEYIHLRDLPDAICVSRTGINDKRAIGKIPPPDFAPTIRQQRWRVSTLMEAGYPIHWDRLAAAIAERNKRKQSRPT